MKTTTFLWTLGFLLALSIASDICTAQQVTGNLELRILDESGNPTPGVNVSVTGPNLQGARRALSTTDGYLRLPALPVGAYELQISHVAYQRVTYEQVVVELGKTTNLGEIRLAAARDQEIVVVVGRKPIVDPTSTDVGGNLNAEALELLPNDRDFLSVISYLPQANTSFFGDGTNIGGGTGPENVYIINGTNVTDPYLGQTTTQLPLNFVREIELKTGGYQAEYGRASGAVINVITRSGSNEHRGEVFTYFTNNDFAANLNRGLFELENDGFSRYDIGLSLGGPVMRDKLWYFAAYDPSFQREEFVLPGFGVHTDDRTTHQFAGKLTWKAGVNTKFDLTMFGDPTAQDQDRVQTFIGNVASSLGNPDPLLAKASAGGFTVALDGQHFLRQSILLEGNLSRFSRRSKLEPATERGRNEPLFQDPERGFLSGGFGGRSDVRSVRTASRLVGTMFFAEHAVKAGIEYEDNLLDEESLWATPDGQDGLLLRETDSQFIATKLSLDHKIHVRVPSVFVQDSWQVSDRLRLNVGARWDGLYIDGPNGDASITDQLQPRAGFVLSPGEIGSQKVFGSYGRYYEQPPGAILSFFVGEGFQRLIAYDADPRDGNAAVLWSYLLKAGDLPIDDDIRGTHFDEFTLGYERRLASEWKVGARGIIRVLRDVIEDGISADFETFVWGNPGRGRLSHFPELERRYMALELLVERNLGRQFLGAASYVLSRNHGNYPGSFSTENGIPLPHGGSHNDLPQQLVNAEGDLPNDRTHVFKVYGSYVSDFGFTAGGFFTLQRGTPVSELAGISLDVTCLPNCTHLVERGTLDRTPPIWDLNLRFSYELAKISGMSRAKPRLLIDVLHVFGQREVTAFDEVHFVDNDSIENPNFLRPVAFQAPMTVRVGIETSF